MLRPTAMLYRNLASMDVEESIRGNPLDGVVLLMGCGKSTPALLMGASSVDIPTLGVSGGPILRGIHCGKAIGSGTNAHFHFHERAVALGTDHAHQVPRSGSRHASVARPLHDNGHRIHGDGAEVLRTEGPPGNGRCGQHAVAAETPEARHQRHRAHFRRANVRRGVRHGGAAYGARVRVRRPACTGGERRPDHA